MAAPTAQKSPAEVEIERLGIAYTEVPQYDLTQLDVTRRVQVRESSHYAPKDQIQRFAVQMSESQFPPIIVTEDGWIVDGNTRIGAKLFRREKLKDDKFFSAIVLSVTYATANEKRKNELHALAATLNSQNGSPLTHAEARAVVEQLVANDWKNDQIARAIGVATGTVTQVRQEIEARKRLRSVGIQNGHMKGASLRALGKTPVLNLNDAPFKELAEMAVDAGLNASEIVSFARQAKETGSDEAAITTLASLRAEMGDRIKDQALTGRSKPPVARQLRQHLGFVAKFAENPAALAETNRDMATQHIEAIETTISILQAVLAAQQAR